MASANAFQRQLIAEIGHVRGQDYADDEMLVRPDTSTQGGVMVMLRYKQVELWIYPDGANILAEGIDDRFEIYDFDDIGDLGRQVVIRIRQL